MSFLDEWKNNSDYFNLLELMARLSNLFSDNSIPFLHYRITEKLFCKYYQADNLSRSDTAYDAKANDFGVGIKTFQLDKGSSVEKVAEFNSISNDLKNYQNYDLAYQVSKARNDRVSLGQRLYAISDGCYHIVGRKQNGLTVFNTPYPFIDLNNIHKVKDTGHSLQFEDGKDFYSYNYSKSTLFKRFIVPKDIVDISVSIIQDPYDLLSHLISSKNYEEKEKDIVGIHSLITQKYVDEKQLVLGKKYVILPLFSVRDNKVSERDGLNKWNANGRPRKANEVSIAIPTKLDKKFPDFFPDITHSFTLHLPNGCSISAKPCEPKIKGALRGHSLQSNPNTDLGKWLLRDILQLPEGQLVTMELLNRMGFNSVIVYKDSDTDYRIDVCRKNSYSSDMFDED